MKIYHTATQEDYDDLMKHLESEDDRTTWFSGSKPRELNYFGSFAPNTCICENDHCLTMQDIFYYQEKYPSQEIIEWKKKENKMKTVEYNNVFPKKIYEEMKNYNIHGLASFWEDYLHERLSKQLFCYITRDETNKRNVAIALATGDFECEKEPVGTIRVKGETQVIIKYPNFGDSYDFDEDLDFNGVQTKFTKEEFEEFKNSLVWEEVEE